MISDKEYLNYDILNIKQSIRATLLSLVFCMSMKIATLYEIILLWLFLFVFTPLAATTTHPDEVKALKDIANTLGKMDWDFSIDPCSGHHSWTSLTVNGVNNNVTCNCSIADDSFCHVVSIHLAGQNLQGSLPPELVRLPHIQQINFSLNYLSGAIPTEWGSLKLEIIHLFGNRLSGSIPVELANITTLRYLILESNRFSGNLPPELGNLPHIEILQLSSNNFTGELPETFSKLITLKDIRLGDNQFSGKIPDYIERWTNLNILEIQGSGLSGPFPSGFSNLQSLIDLKASNLNGPESRFPPVNISGLQRLILRNCNINDTIPDYVGNLLSLKLLDLSYNKLSGQIPSSFEGLNHVDYIYLTGNFLTGSAHEWRQKLSGSTYIDLSYNNFTNDKGGIPECQELNTNLFASFSTKNDSSVSCTRSVKCYQPSYSFHINCGGKKITIGDTTYDGDLAVEEAAISELQNGGKWAVSNTGHFLDNTFHYNYTPQNIVKLPMNIDAQLYMNARTSPLSLTYYGFCLENGNYTVKLHFAEIMFTDDKTYSSLGKRIFDVYIQGERVLKDFNIAEKAEGVGRAYIIPFPAYVSNKALEIRFSWAGKGSTGIPHRSVYGPLISAISVTSDSIPRPPLPSSRKKIHTWVVVAIVAVISIILILVVGILWWRACSRNSNSVAKELKDLHEKIGSFTLRQIKVATNNFNISNKIGEGGFGPVYKGTLSDGTMIAVKQLSSKSKQGNREFITEIGLISALQHPCLVKLYGCCAEGDQLLLVYEYLENNSLAHTLFGREESHLMLDWPTRHKICVGIARGLAFLHEESQLKIVHRDIKATNVLLDKDLNPKISDFGLARLNEEENTHISTRIAGTYGYMAPEYAMFGYLTDKADVYSFGIVALEIVCGKSNTIYRSKEETVCLLDMARILKEEGKLMELVDERLNSNYNEEEVMIMINVALLCANVTSNLRPTMSSVVSMLEGKMVVPELVSNPSEVMDEMKLEEMRQYYNQIEESKRTVQSHSYSIEGSSTADPSSSYSEVKN
ncbi:hypothetical protein VNO77_28107 [Canavalia gladiata]|uniref:non-specific serine/threonine protein kinase n=1 Tax=Canavalia gladiata TaxID=3824 RepID=A0AAN9KVA0_CANGL